MPSDSYHSWITGICVLPGQVLVVDREHKKVILLDQQCQVSHCGVSDYPMGMCEITSSEVAVTVNRCVQFITVTQSQLVTGRKLQFQHRCYGIAIHKGDLFICSGNALFKVLIEWKNDPSTV
ncbi:hypothetical protein DPMN_131311 [Dreissena polymorpha]|uniref:Uncharacterized protein n=1 Tax=Dreissena polymorpha TaxID=45954 RepID=A0A9D4H6C7_DREPO|nr:hypothetical protein DPMN_131311 [Dreissena polymorpha]